MSKKGLGLLVTGLWLIGILFLISYHWNLAKSLSLNEWGDFLAGSTAPVAFLWLIIGYLQQSEELKLNTQALKEHKVEMIQRNQISMEAEIAENTRRKREATLVHFISYGDPIRKANLHLSDNWEEYSHHNNAPISEDRVNELIDSADLLRQVDGGLSAIERFAIATKYGVIEFDLLADNSSGRIIRFYEKMTPYIEKSRELNGPMIYDNAERLVEELRDYRKIRLDRNEEAV